MRANKIKQTEVSLSEKIAEAEHLEHKAKEAFKGALARLARTIEERAHDDARERV